MVVAVIGVAVTSLVIFGRDDDLAVDMHAYDEQILSINDIPVRTFIGWEEQDLVTRPAPAQTPESMSAPDSGQCVPGGELQTRVHEMVVTGTKWAGSRFVNPAAAQIVNVQLSNSEHADPVVIDAWLEACVRTRLVTGGSEEEMQLSSLPVTPAFYRLDEARVYAVTVAGERTVTTMYGWGRAQDVTIQVDYTFAGEPNDDTIAQFDVVWRAQAGKLVGMQEAGVL
ncbi:hypothetical protein HCA61_25700 [Rhodococcus sp. HNM0563]|nr:hypothetical protein [Rhodococcus sp. HNM0563]